ncbi:hypothetical protein PYW07_002839 [Mythimna separata]|uniref:NADH dehydrogenase [ubiquinone] 1 alpha subcomplex subunit 7 n=1 Tax=Mythimna separata TaxID=271217 RepID=A0AAD7YGM1_MYTSE|nr:hypothetical protein PYW07_002839 [Mythimna separata]
MIAPRSIPPPEVPRGPEYKYSDQYYCYRDALNSVKPPVVAPVAAGATRCFPSGGSKLKFPSELPTPGCVWWFDAHCYYKEVKFRPPCHPPSSGPPMAKADDPCTLEARGDTEPKLADCAPCDPCGKDRKK